MERNVGRGDQAVRIVAGVLIIAAGVVFQSWWGLVGLIPLTTGLTNRCPLYTVLHISTRRG